jgi:CheY-like chemotaxis protein
VVDDNYTNRIILEAQLKQWNFIPLITESGSQAINIIQANKQVDLVITDMHMPEMDGVQLAERIRSIRPDLRIILLSSIGNEHSRDHAHLFNLILNKPAKHNVLHKHIIDQLKNNNSSVIKDVPVKQSPLNFNLSLEYPMSILIAEDNLVNQKLMLHILNKMGYQPDIVENGREALTALGKQNYDLVLMDVQMPEMNGLEASQHIRKHMEVQPIIVALTANAMLEDRERCIQAGMNDYLSKPVNIKEIVEVIKKWSSTILQDS